MAHNAKNCNCHCYCVDLQTLIFISSWFDCFRYGLKRQLSFCRFVPEIDCIFDQNNIEPIDIKIAMRMPLLFVQISK